MKGKRLFTDDLAAAYKGSGKKYRPSNGTEGMMFMAMYCDKCVHDGNGIDTPDCPIIPLTLFVDVNDPPYPPEWRFDDDGQPECSAFDDGKVDDPRQSKLFPEAR